MPLRTLADLPAAESFRCIAPISAGAAGHGEIATAPIFPLDYLHLVVYNRQSAILVDATLPVS